MSRRMTQVLLLCEDDQHEAFARRFLETLGVYRRAVRVEKAPRGRGSGEHWVRAAYAKEVKGFRSRNFIEGRALVVMIDEDTAATPARRQALQQALAENGLAPRSQDEAIVHAIPARNIETWLAYLGGSDVNELHPYPRLRRAGDCSTHVAALRAMCDRGALRSPAPASLADACGEFRGRWR